MANTSQKLIDSERRVVYKWTGNTAEAAVLKIDAGALNFSLNVNDQLLGTGTDRKALYRLSLKKVIYDVAPGQAAGNGYVELYWVGTPNQTMLTLSGCGQMDFAEGGDGNDSLYGEDGEDIIEGNNGNDYIESGLGNAVVS